MGSPGDSTASKVRAFLPSPETRIACIHKSIIIVSFTDDNGL
jgi:hypothetical protein